MSDDVGGGGARAGRLVALTSWLCDDARQHVGNLIAMTPPGASGVCDVLLATPVDGNPDGEAPPSEPVWSLVQAMLESKVPDHLVFRNAANKIELLRNIASRVARTAAENLDHGTHLAEDVLLPVFAPLRSVASWLNAKNRATLRKHLSRVGIDDAALEHDATLCAAAIWAAVLKVSDVDDLHDKGMLASRRLAMLVWRQLIQPRAEGRVRLVVCLDRRDRVWFKRAELDRHLRAWYAKSAVQVILTTRNTRRRGDPLAGRGREFLVLNPFAAPWLRRILIAFAMVAASAWWFGRVHISEPSDGTVVRSSTSTPSTTIVVSGTGGLPFFSRYVVVEPIGGERFVQRCREFDAAWLSSWVCDPVYIGDPSTPGGTVFRIYVLETWRRLEEGVDFDVGSGRLSDRVPRQGQSKAIHVTLDR